MRKLEDHIITQADAELVINVVDEPGQGNAHHRYEVVFDTKNGIDSTFIDFQNGPVKEFGVNGVTESALIAIVIDRLRSFQAGDFKSRENACAITNIEQGLHWLQQRTIARQRRGVEGTSQK